MHAWLYGEEGYYRRFRPIGKEGDFFTAVSTSPFFGAAIANELCRRIEAGSIPRDAALVEIGAHQGYLMADMIQWLYTCDPTLLEHMRFVLVEAHEPVRQAQREYFAQRFGDAVRIEQVSSLEALRVPYAFFVANEIFDAFACDLYIDGKTAYVHDEAILWRDAPEALVEHARKYGIQKGEIATGYAPFARRMCGAAEAFDFVTFDYGALYPRNDFSIRIYHEHTVYPLFGEGVELRKLFARSDLTYDVHFEHVRDAFAAEGVEMAAFQKQARALIDFGIIELLEAYAKSASQASYLHHADKIKTLIAPDMMGERFKMAWFARS
jgi:SAM-dependent MidA family methyltransferase